MARAAQGRLGPGARNLPGGPAAPLIKKRHRTAIKSSTAMERVAKRLGRLYVEARECGRTHADCTDRNPVDRVPGPDRCRAAAALGRRGPGDGGRRVRGRRAEQREEEQTPET